LIFARRQNAIAAASRSRFVGVAFVLALVALWQVAAVVDHADSALIPPVQ
jgi:hypothetical protein